jgi:hypothetical protein
LKDSNEIVVEALKDSTRGQRIGRMRSGSMMDINKLIVFKSQKT